MSTEENKAFIMEKTNSKTGYTLKKYGWILLFISATAITFLTLFVSGIYVLSGGHEFMLEDYGRAWIELSSNYPHVAENFITMQKETLVGYLGIGLFSISMIYFPFRDGQRWSWFAMWILPASMVVGTIREFQVQTGFAFFSWALLMSILGLLISYRKFFPRHSQGTN